MVDPIVLDDLRGSQMGTARPAIYDRDIGLRLLLEEPASGAEHYLVLYPQGLRTRPHRHTAAQTIVVLEGRLVVNGETVGPGAYCHLPAGVPMVHGPAPGEVSLFVSIFDRPVETEPLGDWTTS